LPKYLSGEIKPEEQNHQEATFTQKFTTKDSEIDFNSLEKALEGDSKESENIDRKIRALNPEPGVWTIPNKSSFEYLPKGKRVKLLGSEIKDGKLVLNKIQVAGKNIKTIN
ncbi:MAG: hypothetical protein WD471_00160, partial [Candidatus Paceibacterota bacterium]